MEDKMRIKAFVVGALGTNCYLVWDEVSKEAMLLDPGYYEIVIDKEIEERGLSLKYIVLTHGHFDHNLGVTDFMKSNKNVKLAANKADLSLLEALIPSVFYFDEDVIKLGELSFRIMETPGHTKGGLCLYIPETDPAFVDQDFSGTVFTGDTLFNLSVGRTDLGGGNFSELKESIVEKLFSLPDDTLVLPGHMGATTIGIEKEHNPYIR